jgi:hypothetical protein
MKHSNFKKFLDKAKLSLKQDKYIEGSIKKKAKESKEAKAKLTNTLAQPTNTLSQTTNSQAKSSSDRSGTD